MTHPRFFGYGSLVNTRTHSYPDTRPERLSGWRRAWVCTEGYDVALLSAHPAPGHSIDGLTARVPNADWQALDTRERGYDRLPLPHLESETWVYSVPPESRLDGGDHVILRSYLDVVVQGFLDVFGETGVARFFETTDHWHIPVFDDRDAPRYPRHQSLTPAETTLVDAHLERLKS